MNRQDYTSEAVGELLRAIEIERYCEVESYFYSVPENGPARKLGGKIVPYLDKVPALNVAELGRVIPMGFAAIQIGFACDLNKCFPVWEFCSGLHLDPRFIGEEVVKEVPEGVLTIKGEAACSEADARALLLMFLIRKGIVKQIK